MFIAWLSRFAARMWRFAAGLAGEMGRLASCALRLWRAKRSLARGAARLSRGGWWLSSFTSDFCRFPQANAVGGR